MPRQNVTGAEQSIRPCTPRNAERPSVAERAELGQVSYNSVINACAQTGYVERAEMWPRAQDWDGGLCVWGLGGVSGLV